MTELIVNPHAGGFREDVGLSARIERLASGRARIWVPDGRDDLNRACGEIAARGPDRIVLCGGDGTFAAAVTALCDAYAQRPLPDLVLAPAGTVCTIARPFVGWASPLKCVRSALESIAPRIVSQPTLRVTDGGGRVFVGFTVGTGLVANFFAHYEASRRKGRGAAARILLSVALGSMTASHFAGTILSPVPCRVVVDGTQLPESSFSLVVASVLRNLGLSMRVTYRAGEDPDRPHVVASSLGARRLGPRVWRALLGLPLGGPGGFDNLVTTLSVKFPADGPFVLDGDRLLSSEITVTAGPMLRIMTL